jgi:putative ABC transport system permease protein
MIKNYFKVALRNFWKDRISNSLNTLGLSIGMACCMLILIYIQDELSFNRFNPRLRDIYGVQWGTNIKGLTSVFATTPVTLGPAIASDMSQVAEVSRMYQRSGQMLLQASQDRKVSEKKFQEQNVFFSDKDIFTIFQISWIEGSPASALSNVNSAVITDEMAKKYFGTEDPIGKTLNYDNKTLVQVTGVVRKMPRNSDISFDFLLSFETLFVVENQGVANYLKTDWSYNPCYTFIMLKPGQHPEAIAFSLNQLLKKYGDERSKKLYTVTIEPLDKIHLYAASVIGNLSSNSISYVYIFAGIAFLILVIANVNFINLATARSTGRAREVGMRKVMGASKMQLVIQFLGENTVVVFFAFLFSLILTYFFLPVLNQLTAKQLPRFSWLSLPNLLLFISIFFCAGMVAGLYPAFFVSRFHPADSVKGKSGEFHSRNFLRKALLVAQFSISILLIVGAIVIYQQLQYLRNKPLGFQKELMVTVPIFGTGSSSIGYGVDMPMRQRMNLFTSELLKFSAIRAATAASGLPGQGFVQGLVIPQGFSEKDNIFLPWVSVDYNFISTFKIPILAGRDFSKATGSDHLRAFILSEAAVRSFNWKSPQEAIGKNIIRGDAQNGKKGQVIGVVKDFNFNTLDQPIQPLIMDVEVSRLTQFAISIQAGHIPQTIAFIKNKWEEIFPERVFEYSFLDRDINALYNDRENLSKMIGYFAIIAILLSCMGLFSLTSYLSVQRSREVGIRKVLGANVSSIISLLSRDFLFLVILAFLIATPIAWLTMNHWLQNYAFRINIAWWVFLLAGLFVFLITAITVSFQSIRSAIANPVDSLRTE